MSAQLPAQTEAPIASEVVSNAVPPAGETVPAPAGETVPAPADEDRLWVINTRTLASDACQANLAQPRFDVRRLTCQGSCRRSALNEYLQSAGQDRPVVIYVHGNRMDSQDAIRRGLSVYRYTMARRHVGPVDWVVWSWPSSRQGVLVHDFREKADRTDAQGLYLAWLLRKHAEAAHPTSLIGYSFGGRVVTGALHALAGGRLGGRRLPGPAVTGADIDVGLVAPAIGSDWLVPRAYHGRASNNLDRLVLLYNRRDAVLKRYWLIDRMRGSDAMGYRGVQTVGLGADGSRVSVRSRDCSCHVGRQHAELNYYTSCCGAGTEMASLIDDIQITH
ncbi:MAG: alpha/beta hydrolase [Pirellulales bacterium]|nr:alpha/beta hydrolase [Pirellulales bacterium]